MFYRKLEVNDLLNKHADNKQIVDILERENSHLRLISLKKDDTFDLHVSNTDVFIYLLEGEIEIMFPKESSCGCGCDSGFCGCDLADEDDETSKKYKIKKNQMFMFEKEIEHGLKALKDSIFIQVKM